MTCKFQPPASGEVDVWIVELDQLDAEFVRTLLHALSSDEISRAERFRLEKHQEHFARSRGLLRWMLARCLDADPKQLDIGYGPHGKPELAKADRSGRATDCRRLCFNVSHSHELAAFALAWDRELGIDIEKIRHDLSWKEIARRYFSETEVAAIDNLPMDQPLRTFFTYWTRKEALGKATGKGVFDGLKHLNSVTGWATSVAPVQSATGWVCLDLDVGSPSGAEYAGAIVTQGQPTALRQRGLQA